MSTGLSKSQCKRRHAQVSVVSHTQIQQRHLVICFSVIGVNVKSFFVHIKKYSLSIYLFQSQQSRKRVVNDLNCR